jgi:ketosteroid isomerase-like protein
MSNIETVQAIYAAFGAGNIPAILGHLADDVEWEYGQGTTDVPWLQSRKGRDAVGGFFEALGALEFHAFEVHGLLDGGATVAALVNADFTVRATGQRVAERDEIHLWRFGPDGKVTSFRHGADTHAHYVAYHG